jgi:hypothetical protein
MQGIRLRVREIRIFERLMRFERPFRFGLVTVDAAPQAFVRAVVEVEGAGVATGVTAEMMMPKWFDKNPAKSPDETIADLRSSLEHAARGYAENGSWKTAFGLHADVLPGQEAWAEARGLPGLVASYGPALVDKAILDGTLKALGIDLATGLRRNVPGLDARLTPDLSDESLQSFLRGVSPSTHVALRHTIGLVDPLDGPGGVEGEIDRARLSLFKIKIGGDVTADLARLRAIARTLTVRVPDYKATLDANEQYDPDRLHALLSALSSKNDLRGLRERLLYIEQPLDRATTFRTPLSALADEMPFIIDEADGRYDAFPRAVVLGYRGVSSKACKGLYKSVLNAARAAALNDGSPGRYFVSGEDLTCQAGLAIQQDTALVAALGLAHAERNGHHYVDGFGSAPEAEVAGFAGAHPDLYVRSGSRAELAIAKGFLPTTSLFSQPGFASGAEPDWDSLVPLSAMTAPKEISA